MVAADVLVLDVTSPDEEVVLEVVSVLPVVVEVLLVVEVGVGGLMPSQSLLIFTSAQFQNCSAARVTSTGCLQEGRLPGSKKGGKG